MRYGNFRLQTSQWIAVMAFAGIVGVAGAPAPVLAQNGSPDARAQRQERRRARQEAQEQRQADKGKKQDPKRAALERQYRARGEQVIREKLQLTDGQMSKLRTVNQRYDGQRRDLLQRETGLRTELRTEIAKGKGANQGRVAQLMSQADQLQRERFELNRTETKEVGGFLTPVQQAQYQGLQAQMRKRVQNMREQQAGSAETP